jgi:N-carbamoylputrescine amidase
LSFDGQELALQLRNVGDSQITDATVTFRLPLGWAEGVAVRSLPALGAGRALRETLRPTRRDSSPGLHVGKAYFVAQIDFRVGDAPGRLYATCNFENPPDASFPKGRFGVLGPIDPEAFDATAFAAAIREGGAPPVTWSLADGTAIAWRPGATDGSVPDEFLHHEVIRTQGEWFLNQSPLYVLHSVVESPDARPVRIECAREDVPLLYLNGDRVTGQDALLQAGPNHLVLAYHHATQMDLARHSGCFLRLSDPATGARMRDIIYRLPLQEAPMATRPDAAANEPGALTIALLQMVPKGSDQDANLAEADRLCRNAAQQGADIALMPEMFNIGYLGFEGTDAETVAAWQAQAVARDSAFVHHFADLARELSMAIGVTYLEQWPGAPRNTLTVFDRNGAHVLTYAKIHTCDFAAFEASMTPGEDFHVADLDTAKGTVRLGAMICFDREFPESARILMLKGAELVLVPNACLLDDLRLGQFRSRAYENSMVMAMTNYAQLGGKSVAYGVQGEDLGVASDEDGVFLVSADMEGARRFRETSIWGNAFRRPHKYGELLSLEKEDIWKRPTGLGEPFVAEER